jgi:hypothetical protein
MPSITTVTFVLLLLLAVSIELFRPSSMTNSINKPWADGPCALITTPEYATKKVFA